jgi:hypothetical protein
MYTIFVVLKKTNFCSQHFSVIPMGMMAQAELSAFLTTPLHPPPLLLLPLLEKLLLAQRLAMGVVGIGLVMHSKMLQVTLIGIVAGKPAHDLPE